VKNLNYKSLTSKTRLYNLDIPIIAITGGIGTGKTQASSFLRKLGKKIICADSLVKKIYKTDEAKELIRKIAPDAINDDSINFRILRSLFFNDLSIKQKVEQYIYSKLHSFFTHEVSEQDKVIFYDVPLLFEKKLDDKVDYSILIYCDEKNQVNRIVSRDKITPEKAKKIISCQIPIDKKIKISDHIIYNTSTIKELEINLQIFLNEILKV